MKYNLSDFETRENYLKQVKDNKQFNIYKKEKTDFAERLVDGIKNVKK